MVLNIYLYSDVLVCKSDKTDCMIAKDFTVQSMS